MDINTTKKCVDALLKANEKDLAKKLLDEACDCNLSWAGSWSVEQQMTQAIEWITLYEKYNWTPIETPGEFL